jgi:hypothetical protein
MKKKSRLFALLGALGLAALTGTAGAEVVPIEFFCLCACPNGTIICVESIKGDCGVPCAQAMQHCPGDS